jgi:hypothetical protein
MHLDDIKQFINFLNFDINIFFITLMIFTIYHLGLFLFSNNNKKDQVYFEMNNSSDDESENNNPSEENNECSDESEEKYTSILFKSFMIMTKKQLLKITGNKYKNSNKDELIIIAMTKFILNSIENYNYMPIDSKNFVKKNKEIMKDEFYELYKIHKMNQQFDKIEELKEQNKNEENEMEDNENEVEDDENEDKDDDYLYTEVLNT